MKKANSLVHDRLGKLLPEYRGIGKRSDRFLKFLRSRRAGASVMSMFRSFALTGQIELDDGIAFAENDVLCRNEFVKGDFIVFGVNCKYDPLVLNIKTGNVGTLADGADGYHIRPADVDLTSVSFLEFLAAHAKGGARSPYLVPAVFNVDAVSIMKAYSGFGGVTVTRTSPKFRNWLEHVGLGKPFCLYSVTPKTEFPAGACTIMSEAGIMEANFKERRRNNPRFVFIGTCPDGSFVVLDKSTSPPSVGYVAFMEIGDEPGWENHYVRVSNSLGEFLNDSNFLGILPDDYYLAKELYADSENG